MLKTPSLVQQQPGQFTEQLVSLTIPSNVSQLQEVSYVFCGEEHTFENCSFNPASVYYMGNQNRNNGMQSNSYNPTWRQHLNFSWRDQGMNANQGVIPKLMSPTNFTKQQVQPRRPQYQPQPSNSLENMMKEFMARTDTTI